MEGAKLLFAGFFLFSLVGLTTVIADSSKPCEFPAIFNFGDSNSATGTQSAQTNSQSPNVDGRTCDGHLIIDFIADHLKLPYLSAYANSLEENYQHGANFAIKGSAIWQNTTFNESRNSLNVQIQNFNQFKSHTKQPNNEADNASNRNKLPSQEDFAKALYTFDIGQNDISWKSFDQVRPQIPDIIDQLTSSIQNIYQQGGGTFWIHNTGPIGCLPINVIQNHNSTQGNTDKYGCLQSYNDMTAKFNKQLKERVTKLKSELLKVAITYVDIYTAKYELISHTRTLGFGDPFKVCCGYQENQDRLLCGNMTTINNVEVYADACKDPSKVISWDSTHYT